MKRINFSWVLLAAIACLVGSSIALAEMTAKEKQTARADIQKITNETLQRLYKAQPAPRRRLTVPPVMPCSAILVEDLLAGSRAQAWRSTRAVRLLYENVGGQAGLGLGVKKFRMVWVFEKTADFNKFVNSGWEVGGQTSAAARAATGAAFAGGVSVAGRGCTS
jgi:hypothetical protein